MPHFDKLETRTPKTREAALFRDLAAALAIARTRAPGLRRQLRGIDPQTLASRAGLAKIPVLRKSDLQAMQAESPPFGGLATTRTALLKRLLVSPGPIFEPEGFARDYWGAARALYAAGVRRGDIVLNCFSYHLAPGGHIMESAAHALGCPVIPGGPGNTEQQIDAIRHLRPKAYCGTPDFLKILLDRAQALDCDASSLKNALVSGAALPASLRADLRARGVAVAQAYASADLGVIAYESLDGAGPHPGMIVNEGIVLEIVRPGTGDPVAAGDVGEVVVTRLNGDYPLLRFATGDLSAILPGQSPCGRSNMRIKGWLGRADQSAKVKGMFVHAAQVAEIGRRHPGLGRMRLVVTRHGEQDAMALHCESAAAGDAPAVAATLQDITKLRGEVRFASPGSLPNDGKIIADERPPP